MSYTYKRDKTAKYKESDSISHVHDYGIDIPKNEIFLFPREEYSYSNVEASEEPGIEYTIANQFIRNIRLLSSTSEEPILIHLKSCGGDWIEGLAMYQAILACPNHVTILNYASARSMSSIIFLAGDKRVMMPYSTFMMHKGMTWLGGTGTQVRTEYEEFRKSEEIMMDIYVQALRESNPMEGWSDKKIRSWLEKKMKDKEEVYFTAEEAIEYNFADEIFGKDGKYDWAQLRKP